MIRPRRWESCISHYGDEVTNFIEDYFDDSNRNALIIGGAGFDPRATLVSDLIARAGASVKGLFIREVRPRPAGHLLQRADVNARALTASIANHSVEEIEILGSDGAVIGGLNAARLIARQSFDRITDILVDLSALSVGTSFPIVRYLVEKCVKSNGPPNLHVFVAHDPALDSMISPIATDVPGYVRGFRGGAGLDGAASAARLWLPQLASGRQPLLSRLYDFIEPHDTCPILPFPASDPRLSDRLMGEFRTEFESSWLVDARNIVYATEDDPLDVYRTILGLDDLRRPVFAEVGGSSVILSPVGSKVMALGALMAALERDLPVAYLESIGYDLSESVPQTMTSPNLVHVWLESEYYPSERPPLREGR